MHKAQDPRFRSQVSGPRVRQRTHWGLLLLLLAAGCLEECGDEPREFEGVLRCATDSSAPVFTVTVNAGECVYVPRCAGLVLQASILKAESTGLGFGVETNANDANSFLHASKIRVPRPPFVSTNSNVHPHLYLDWKRRRAEDPEEAVICAKVGTNAPADEPVEAWAGYSGPSTPPTPDYESFAMEFYVTITEPAEPTDAGVSEDAGPTPDAGTPDSGSADASTPDTGTGPADAGNVIASAHISPELPEGVATHFSGVTQYIVAQFDFEGAHLDKVECTAEMGEVCEHFQPNATPTVGSPPRSQVPLPQQMPEGEYKFTLQAELNGARSVAVELSAELGPGVGVLACERSSNGRLDGEKARHLGLKLLDPGESPVSSADYYVYVRRDDTIGWEAFELPSFKGVEFVELRFEASEFDRGRTFLVIAVDTETHTAVAAREFSWEQDATTPTQGCPAYDMSSNGNCTIISTGG